MKTNEYNNLAALLIEYSKELTGREHKATNNRDFEQLKKLNKIKTNISELLEALDDEG